MKTKNLRGTADPYRNLVNASDRAVIAWTDLSGVARTSVADQRCLQHGLESARILRRPVKYQHRRNYEGYYWCSGSGESVWYESMTEYSALMHLDHTLNLIKVAAQPLCILFTDGTRHYPDYFALHESGRQVLYDVRPAELVDEKAEIQFAKTREVCAKIGWGYEVLHGLTGMPRHNLEWLAGYRHPYIDLGLQMRTRILDEASEPSPLAQLAVALDSTHPVRFLPGIYHLLWRRDLTYDPSRPLGWHTIVERRKRG
ncbi:TnsA-like heteromeric transposase endonuclease subunit [Arthrobacter sp. NPDC058127]|uniref:TnsA-like heteromeric transposase endonuclease subunit n=1 Tax=Arthrobacter sp. NPDC058127 TaxID=3346351 RepID=UPI0036E9FAC5